MKILIMKYSGGNQEDLIWYSKREAGNIYEVLKIESQYYITKKGKILKRDAELI